MPSKTGPKASKSPLKTGSKPEKKKPLPKDYSRQISEKEIHMKAWQWVKTYYPDLLIFHVPSGEPRDVVVAMKLKRMGVVAGVLVLPDGRAAFPRGEDAERSAVSRADGIYGPLQGSRSALRDRALSGRGGGGFRVLGRATRRCAAGRMRAELTAV